METKIIFLIVALCAFVISLIVWLILDRRMDKLSDRLDDLDSSFVHYANRHATQHEELKTKVHKVANPAKFQKGDKVRIVNNVIREQSGKILEEPKMTERLGVCWTYKIYCLETNEVVELYEGLLQPLTQEKQKS